MKTSIRVSYLLGLTIALAHPLHGQETDRPASDEVRTVIEAVNLGMQAGDWASLDTLFSESRGLHIIEGAGVNHGWADYRDSHLAPDLESFENFSYRWFAIEPVVDGDASWAAFRYELSANTSSGPLEVEGRGTIVLQRREGRWRVVHLHTSGGRTD